MLEKIDLSHRLSKKEYKAEIDGLEMCLSGLQQKIKELKIPVIIVFEGWSASGKGTCISEILYSLDPRYYNVYTMAKLAEGAAMRPLLWNYWIKTPLKGRITVFDKSWHRAALPDWQEKRPLSAAERNGFYYDVMAFERQLCEDGALIIKLFLHVSRDEQKKRFDELLKNPGTKWRIDQHDIRQNKNYEKYVEYFENMIQQSNLGLSEWNIIEADDKNYAVNKIYKVIINKIEAEINKRIYNKKIISGGIENTLPEPPSVSILSSVNPAKDIPDDEYKNQLKYYQNKLSYLGYKLYAKRKPVIIVYEGWDAAGKGGNIRRITQKLDPRGYEVVPVAAPSQEELAHHYLWRFWQAFPKDGHFTIFDRSWYGRVMVERIEHFCSDDEWRRAYKEINDMELHLHNHGAIIFKFWLHIDKDEQLRRFKAREEDPLKQYKITQEDWRNRDKWDEYEKAVDEMLFRTSTSYAPWTVVESNNKKFARIKTLKLVVDTLEEKLK